MQAVQLPYLIVAALLLVLALLIARFPLPALHAGSRRATKEQRASLSLWRHRNLVFGIPAMFIWPIADVQNGSVYGVVAARTSRADRFRYLPRCDGLSSVDDSQRIYPIDFPSIMFFNFSTDRNYRTP